MKLFIKTAAAATTSLTFVLVNVHYHLQVYGQYDFLFL